MTTRRFTVVVEIDAENNTAQAFGEFNKGVNSVGKSSKLLDGVMNAVGQRLVGFAEQLPQIAIQAIQLGAQVEASAVRFERFAGSTERADKLLEAFNEATLGTVDKMGAMSSAGRLLQMGLVNTADEMSTVAKIATQLGDQTLGATDRVSDFSALLANQSIPRLDNFGISSGTVRNRIKELQAATEGLTREQAFQQAVLEEGEKALARLGDTSDLASTKISKVSASWATLGQTISEALAAAATGGTLLDKLAASLDTVSQRTLDVNEGLERAKELGVAPRIFAEAYADAAAAARLFQGDEDELRATLEEATEATKEAEEEARRLAAAIREGSGANFDYGDSTDDAESGLSDLETGLNRVGAAYQKQAREARMAATEAILAAQDQAREVRALLVDASADLTAFATRSADSAEDLADDREAIEQKHADNIAKIQDRGRAKAIRFDALAEQEKLDNLKFKLDQALLQQTEFGDKTRQSVRNAKEFQIANLRDEIGEREQRFATFEQGRLFKAGENITGLLTQEQERHDESLRLLQEAEEEQELANQQSLGRIVLANFTAWATIREVSEDEILAGRIFIQEQYGLIDEAGAEAARNMTADFKLMIDLTVAEFARLKASIDAIPRHINIDVEIAQRNAPGPSTTGGGGGFAGQNDFQSGGVTGGGLVTMNEGGGEMVRLPRGAQVVNNNQTDNFIMNLTSQSPAGPIQEFELMRALARR